MSKKLLSKIWISSILLTILISIVLFLIWHDNIIDYEVYNKISNLINPTLTNILIFITNLSSTYVIITVISLLFWYFLFIKKNSKLAIISFIIPVITILLNQWLNIFYPKTKTKYFKINRGVWGHLSHLGIQWWVWLYIEWLLCIVITL